MDTDDAIFPVGSLQVLAGCTYYGFTEQNYAVSKGFDNICRIFFPYTYKLIMYKVSSLLVDKYLSRNTL